MKESTKIRIGRDNMNNIKLLRKEKKLSQKQLADILFVNQTAISQWERGETSPNKTTLEKMCDFFDTTSDYILGYADAPKRKKGVRIPVYGHVAAGIPISAIEDILDYEEISEDEARKGEYFALQIKGHSMEPRIYDKDVVIVRRQSDVDNGDIAIVLVNEEEATCKKIKKTSEGVMLIPLNPDYETMFYSNTQIEQLPVIVLGKVVECRSKFERI